MPSLPDLTLPDPRHFTAGHVYLLEWCAAQPDRSTAEKVAELARLAGCSHFNMHQVLVGKRALSVRCARALVDGLMLEPEAAEHLLNLFELPHLPPRLAQDRRERVLAEVARATGLPWGAAEDLLAPQPDDGAVVAALSAALAAYDDDLPSLPQLNASAVPPVTPALIEEALAHRGALRRLAPRLVALHPPDEPGAASAHQGLLAFAGEARLRLGRTQRDFRSYVATADEQASLAFEAACRRLEATLTQLCEDAELRVPGPLMVLAVQRFVAAGPFPRGCNSGVRWQRPSVRLAPVDPAPEPDPPPSPEPAAHPPPHPTGITWFPTWMTVWRDWATVQGHPCSDGWFANQTGLSRSLIYDLRTGAVRFSSQHVFRFFKPFGFERDKAGQEALEGMAMVASPDDPRATARLIHALRLVGAQSGRRHPAIEAHFVQSKWYAHVIRQLAELDGFQPLHGWVSRILKGRIEWRAAQEALTALSTLGLLRRGPDGRTVVVEPQYQTEGPHATIALHEYHQGLLSLYQIEISHGDRDLSPRAWLVGLPEKARPHFQRAQATFDQEVYEALQGAEARHKAGQPMDRVLVISRQSFPVFLPEPAPRRARKKPPKTP